MAHNHLLDDGDRKRNRNGAVKNTLSIVLGPRVQRERACRTGAGIVRDQEGRARFR